MTVVHYLQPAVHAGVVVLAALVLARAGHALARLVGQPPVIGEIAVGLVIGPVLLATVGPKSFDALLPNPTGQTLQLIGLAGLVLFLVGVAHEINAPRRAGWFRTVELCWFRLVCFRSLDWYCIRSMDMDIG